MGCYDNAKEKCFGAMAAATPQKRQLETIPHGAPLQAKPLLRYRQSVGDSSLFKRFFEAKNDNVAKCFLLL